MAMEEEPGSSAASRPVDIAEVSGLSASLVSAAVVVHVKYSVSVGHMSNSVLIHSHIESGSRFAGGSSSVVEEEMSSVCSSWISRRSPSLLSNPCNPGPATG